MSRLKNNDPSNNVDLSQYPTPKINPSEGDVPCLGDVHGNAVKMLYFLVMEGVIKLKNGAEDYALYVKLYDDFLTIITDDFSTDEKFKTFVGQLRRAPKNSSGRANSDPIFNNTVIQQRIDLMVADNQVKIKKIIEEMDRIISEATVCAPRKIRFIGDMLADRGACDLFTLRILSKLKEHKEMQVVILYSNHDDIFMQHFYLRDKPNLSFEEVELNWMQALSLQSLCALVKNDIVTENAVKKLVRDAYLPCLKLLDCSNRPIETPRHEVLRLYVHTPIGQEQLDNFASWFLSEEPELHQNMFDDVASFMQAVEKINNVFSALLVPEAKRNEEKWLLVSGHENSFVWIRLKRGRDRCPIIPSITLGSGDAKNNKVLIIFGHDGKPGNDISKYYICLNSGIGHGFYDAVLDCVEIKYRKLYIEAYGFPLYAKNTSQLVKTLREPGPLGVSSSNDGSDVFLKESAGDDDAPARISAACFFTSPIGHAAAHQKVEATDDGRAKAAASS